MLHYLPSFICQHSEQRMDADDHEADIPWRIILSGQPLNDGVHLGRLRLTVQSAHDKDEM
jgi:hypothetical protein